MVLEPNSPGVSFWQIPEAVVVGKAVKCLFEDDDKGCKNCIDYRLFSYFCSYWTLMPSGFWLIRLDYWIFFKYWGCRGVIMYSSSRGKWVYFFFFGDASERYKFFWGSVTSLFTESGVEGYIFLSSYFLERSCSVPTCGFSGMIVRDWNWLNCVLVRLWRKKVFIFLFR